MARQQYDYRWSDQRNMYEVYHIMTGAHIRWTTNVDKAREWATVLNNGGRVLG